MKKIDKMLDVFEASRDYYEMPGVVNKFISAAREEKEGILCLISDLAMYREDISNCPGRFQRVVDELIKELNY